MCTVNEETGLPLNDTETIACRTQYRIDSCAITEDGTPLVAGEDKDICILENTKACIINDELEPLKKQEKVVCMHKRRREDMELYSGVFLVVLGSFIAIGFICILVALLKNANSAKFCSCCKRKKAKDSRVVNFNEQMPINSPRDNKVTPINADYGLVVDNEHSVPEKPEQQ